MLATPTPTPIKKDASHPSSSTCMWGSPPSSPGCGMNETVWTRTSGCKEGGTRSAIAVVTVASFGSSLAVASIFPRSNKQEALSPHETRSFDMPLTQEIEKTLEEVTFRPMHRLLAA